MCDGAFSFSHTRHLPPSTVVVARTHGDIVPPQGLLTVRTCAFPPDAEGMRRMVHAGYDAAGVLKEPGRSAARPVMAYSMLESAIGMAELAIGAALVGIAWILRLCEEVSALHQSAYTFFFIHNGSTSKTRNRKPSTHA